MTPCPTCGGPTRAHYQPAVMAASCTNDRCRWLVCLDPTCGGFGDPDVRWAHDPRKAKR